MARNARWTLIKIKSASMYKDISIERLQEIEQERNQTMADKAYQRWMQELKVASMYIDRTPIHNAQHAMQEWDISRFRIK
jgi:hypothetical protein